MAHGEPLIGAKLYHSRRIYKHLRSCRFFKGFSISGIKGKLRCRADKYRFNLMIYTKIFNKHIIAFFICYMWSDKAFVGKK
ncbi:hypothetical protein SDC9_211334 [bioreactor metagenome]|uniref:Uncharacterized protein n=1 Tax=bioreactor metagenome TaxID=1076179 RepID=A0A645JKC7_9ZZZZ